MSKKKMAGILSVFLLLLGIGVAFHGVHRVDPHRLDKLIRQDLPLGKDKSLVIAFLDSQHISHTEYIEEHRMVQAAINRSSIGLINGRIHIDFWFDENGKLIRYELVELFDFL